MHKGSAFLYHPPRNSSFKIFRSLVMHTTVNCCSLSMYHAHTSLMQLQCKSRCRCNISMLPFQASWRLIYSAPKCTSTPLARHADGLLLEHLSGVPNILQVGLPCCAPQPPAGATSERPHCIAACGRLPVAMLLQMQVQGIPCCTWRPKPLTCRDRP
jgi:hypothetical protein